MQDSRSKNHKDDFFLHLLLRLSKIHSEIPVTRTFPIAMA